MCSDPDPITFVGRAGRGTFTQGRFTEHSAQWNFQSSLWWDRILTAACAASQQQCQQAEEHAVHQGPHARFMSRGSSKHCPKQRGNTLQLSSKSACLGLRTTCTMSALLAESGSRLYFQTHLWAEQVSDPFLWNKFWAWHRDPWGCWFTSLGLSSLQLSTC